MHPSQKSKKLQRRASCYEHWQNRLKDTLSFLDNVTEDPAEDMFSQSCRSKQRKVYGDKGWPEYLEGAYVRYKSALSSKYSSMWDFIRGDPVKKGRWYPLRGGRQRFQTDAALKIRGGSQPHRQVVITIDDYGDESRPSVSELVALVLVISFLKPARARVLQGYFDGTLKIQFTKLYDFNVPNYTDLMNCLLRWGYATRMGIPRWKHLY
ncbi:hypothetical protein M432DRAFT_668399 [Thermoascus aurantiacus ATCC 26904]